MGVSMPNFCSQEDISIFLIRMIAWNEKHNARFFRKGRYHTELIGEMLLDAFGTAFIKTYSIYDNVSFVGLPGSRYSNPSSPLMARFFQLPSLPCCLAALWEAWYSVCLCFLDISGHTKTCHWPPDAQHSFEVGRAVYIYSRTSSGDIAQYFWAPYCRKSFWTRADGRQKYDFNNLFFWKMAVQRPCSLFVLSLKDSLLLVQSITLLAHIFSLSDIISPV